MGYNKQVCLYHHLSFYFELAIKVLRAPKKREMISFSFVLRNNTPLNFDVKASSRGLPKVDCVAHLAPSRNNVYEFAIYKLLHYVELRLFDYLWPSYTWFDNLCLCLL